MNTEEYAPIVLFAYNRVHHLEQVVEALRKNKEAEHSQLYVFVDGPANETQVDAVLKVTEFVNDLVWKGGKTVFISKFNKGLKKSIREGCDMVFANHDQAIILEDDIIVSAGFLNFMNNSLTSYKNEEEVFGVSGFTYRTPFRQKESFFLTLGSSWGWATWKSRWEKVSFDGPALIAEIEKEGRIPDFNFGKYPYFEMLKKQVEKSGNSWAIFFYASMFLERGLFFFPAQSLVKNIGFDHSGTNEVGGYDIVSPSVIQEIEFNKVAVGVDPKIEAMFKRSFQESLKVSFGAEMKLFIKRVKEKIF